MIYVKTQRNQYRSYAEYNVGNNTSIKIKFTLRFPAELPNYLTPLISTANLYDNTYVSLQFVNPLAVDISQTNVGVNKDGETVYHLFFQTNFRIEDSSLTREKLEELIKKCKTNYTISGGADGVKEYSLHDSIAITEDKLELFVFKQIDLKK
jgi:hypothetical protein